MEFFNCPSTLALHLPTVASQSVHTSGACHESRVAIQRPLLIDPFFFIQGLLMSTWYKKNEQSQPNSQPPKLNKVQILNLGKLDICDFNEPKLD